MGQPAVPSDREFLTRLQKLGRCRIGDLCVAFGVTATAIRQRVTRLESAGLIERETVRAERGRPFHEYRLTAAGRRTLGDDSRVLARLLWQEIGRLEDGETRRRLLAGLRERLVDRYRPAARATGVTERFHGLRQALDEEGFEVEVDQRTAGDRVLPILREHCCPYQELAAEDSSICELEQSVFEEVVGVPIALTQCCRNGHSCCEFEPVSTS